MEHEKTQRQMMWKDMGIKRPNKVRKSSSHSAIFVRKSFNASQHSVVQTNSYTIPAS